MYRYRQLSTGQVVERPEPWESAEASEDWELTLEAADEVSEPDEPTNEDETSTVSDPVDPVEEDLEELTRPVLNERAITLGVEAPEELPNKDAVIEAIEAATEEEATDDE